MLGAPQLNGWDPRSFATAAQTTTAAGEPESYVPLPLLLLGSLCCGLHFISPYSLPLCVLVHPPLHLQVCEILWSPGVLGRGTFVELWMFYWFFIEGKN